MAKIIDPKFTKPKPLTRSRIIAILVTQSEKEDGFADYCEKKDAKPESSQDATWEKSAALEHREIAAALREAAELLAKGR